MQYFIQLEWKDFVINLDKVRSYLKLNLTSNYDGLVCDQDHIYIVFLSDIIQSDSDAAQTYWDTITLSSFLPTIDEIIDIKINGAVQFGIALITSIAKENVKMGITQANKTKDVSDYCNTVARYLREGSLYAALSEIDILIAAGIPSSLSPFITTDRITTTRAKIASYIGL